jgi:hypothetical protein
MAINTSIWPYGQQATVRFGGRHPQNRVGREGNLAREGGVRQAGRCASLSDLTFAAKFQLSGDPFTFTKRFVFIPAIRGRSPGFRLL